MGDVPIWRYLSLAKYVDLLRTKSLFFPKASLFNDVTEGKWWGHSHLYEQAKPWSQAPANVRILEGVLERAGQDPSALLQEMRKVYESSNEWVRKILDTVFRAYPHKRRGCIEGVISSWKRNYNSHNQEVRQWKSDMEIFRESTYISCWNRASSMSLAMWEMYGGGREAVAVRSAKHKLEGLLTNNAPFLEQHGLTGGLAEVQYLDGLKNPDEAVQGRIYKIIFEEAQDVRIGIFTIKPSIFYFEQEVRAIIYPKRELLDPIEDPHPDISGFSLSIGDKSQRELPLASFIEAIYIHPTLGEESITFQAVKEINRLFGVPEIPIIADRIEALGDDLALQPIVDSGLGSS